MSGSNRGINDPRFSKVFSDPRFRNIRRKDLKVKLDDRFNKKDLKNEFSLLKSTAKVDKYGGKIKQNDEVVDNLDKYYEDDEEKKDGEESGEDEESNEDKSEDEESEEDASENAAEVETKETSDSEVEEDPLAKARGLVDTNSDSASDSSDEEIEDEYESEEETAEQIPELDPTNRIAVVNLDWDHLNSNDLYATFNSFLPKDGEIKNVTIYKSQYGKERLADEELNGPPKEIFKSVNEKKDDSDSDSDDDDLDLAKATKKLIEENNGEDEGFNPSELRKYQLQRLRYYYAIIEFNSLESSIEIYKKCDNTEFESSGNFFDLRYVPNDMDFDVTDIRDSCNSLPSNYQPIEFATDSLRNSKPKLTWDETPIERVQILSKSFKQGELDDLDLKNYLASGSEDEDETQNISKYKQLIGNSTKESKAEGLSDDNEDDIDMEFTFTPTAANSGKTAADQELTPIEKLRLKEKERRKNRKQKVKELKREAHNESKKKQSKQQSDENGDEPLEIEERGKEAKELDHFNIKDVEKLEKLKSKKNKFKNKRQRELQNELETRLQNSGQDELKVDDRFSEMIDSHAFAGGSKLLQQERKRRKKDSRK